MLLTKKKGGGVDNLNWILLIRYIKLTGFGRFPKILHLHHSIRNSLLYFKCTAEGLGGSLDKIRTRTSVDIQAQAVRDLIERLLPERASEFDVKVEPGLPQDENGYFQVDSNSFGFWEWVKCEQKIVSYLQVVKTQDNTTVFLQGSTGVMAAWGFHYYLTQLCQCQVSWDADQLDLPIILPEVSVRITSLDK